MAKNVSISLSMARLGGKLQNLKKWYKWYKVVRHKGKPCSFGTPPFKPTEMHKLVQISHLGKEWVLMHHFKVIWY